MGNIKEVSITIGTYYFFDHMINIANFDAKLLEIDKKSYKNIDIYCIGCITTKDSGYVKIKSVNPLHLIISEADGYFEQKNENKYLPLNSTNKNKEVLKKYTELWDEIKNEIVTINGVKPGEYERNSMKMKFNSDNNIPLNKTLKLHNMTIIISFAFKEDGKFYPQIYLDECLYEL